MLGLMEIDAIMRNPNLTLKIKIPNKELITGFVTSDTTMGSTADYDTVEELLARAGGAVLDGASKLSYLPGVGGKLGKAVDIMRRFGGGIYDATTLIGRGSSVVGSVKRWTGSSFEFPSIDIVFVALSPDDRPQDKAKTLIACCLPGTPPIGDVTDHDAFFWAPNEYSPWKVFKNLFQGDSFLPTNVGYGKGIEGTCTLEIGRWFKCDGLLPMNANFTFSKEVTIRGNPLYVTGSVDFAPYRDVKAVEFESFIQS